jgi:undecaprenyl-diphosphatase
VAIVLGVIEGVTEFLPVSSTGHLLLAQAWLPAQSALFNTVIQSGAVLAVGLVFTRRLRELALEWRAPATRDYAFKLAAAFVLTALCGLGLKWLGWKLPERAAPVAWATLVGGVLFLVVERRLAGRTPRTEIPWPVAVAVGLAQVAAGALPGTSRSGATILAALLLGVERRAATEFSFLLGVPTLLAAGAYECWAVQRDGGLGAVNWPLLLLATAVSAGTAFVVVRWLLHFVQTHTFVVFGWYRVALGAAILLLARER